MLQNAIDVAVLSGFSYMFDLRRFLEARKANSVGPLSSQIPQKQGPRSIGHASIVFGRLGVLPRQKLLAPSRTLTVSSLPIALRCLPAEVGFLPVFAHGRCRLFHWRPECSEPAQNKRTGHQNALTAATPSWGSMPGYFVQQRASIPNAW
jgi:hypothetical protein